MITQTLSTEVAVIGLPWSPVRLKDCRQSLAENDVLKKYSSGESTKIEHKERVYIDLLIMFVSSVTS